MTPSSRTVFIVDDDAAVLSSLALLFQAVGLHAETFDSAQAFLQVCPPHPAGCLILDVRMPGMSGLELLAELATRQIRIPTIMLTAYADVPTTVRAFKAGAIDVIEKPFDGQTLLQRVNEALALETHADQSAERKLAYLTLASMGDGVITLDNANRVQYLNPMAEYMTGWSVAEARNAPLAKVFNVVDETTRHYVGVEHYTEETRNGAGAESRMVLLSRDERECAINLSLSPILDPQENRLGAVIIFHDETQARAMSRQLAYQATHDGLTSLVNRREFERRLERALANVRENKGEYVLLYMDLDRFKAINDTAGHAAGDQLLRQLGIMLGEKLRQRDTLARLGGDEFAVLLEHCPLDRAERIAEEIGRIVGDFRLHWQDSRLAVGVSIGVAAVTANRENAAQVLQIADAACYQAKKKGGNGVYVHHEEGEHPHRWDWVSYLERALQEDRLQLFSQMMAPLGGDTEGQHYEILLRMQGPLEDTATAGAFLPASERPNLGPILNRWMIRDVLKWLIQDPRRLQRLRTCTINLSRHTLADEDFPDYLLHRLVRSDFLRSKLCFTFNEATITGDLDKAATLLKTIKTAGSRIAVDGFASTLAGFSYLKRLPVDFLRIDGYLIRDMLNDPVAYAMVKSINEIAHAMGIRTVAKNVDTKDILKMLHLLGVDFAQGYYIAKPERLEY